LAKCFKRSKSDAKEEYEADCIVYFREQNQFDRKRETETTQDQPAYECRARFQVLFVMKPQSRDEAADAGLIEKRQGYCGAQHGDT
jgi:hypothetical protein